MKRYYSAIAFITAFCSLILFSRFDYSLRVIFFHLSVIAGLTLVASWACNFAGFIKNNILKNVVQHLICFLFLFMLSAFYLVTLGSLYFWGKVIELKLLIDYLSSLGGLIDTLPVQSSLIYFLLFFFIAIVCVLYYFVRLRPAEKLNASLKQYLIASGVAVVLAIVLYNPLIHYKRYIHAAGEPVLEFLFPRAWHTETEMEIYKGILVKETTADKNCLQAIKAETIHPANRNFVLIVVDALRSDHLPAYGYDRPTTPFLDSLLGTGNALKIQHPFSLSTNTLSGIANIFTSKPMQQFTFSAPGLMKYMKLKNFSTYAFVTGAHSQWYWLSDIYRNDCDFFYESKSQLSQNDDDRPTVEEFTSTEFNDNFFAYVHLMSAHILGYKADRFKKFMPDKIGAGSDKAATLINNYDNGILQADYLIRRVFEKLQQDSLLENTTVFITADHGELFGEDNRYKHNESLHPALQSVPLLIYDHDTTWYQNTYAATLLDIAPTIADRIGYTVPDCWEGTSLHRPAADFEVSLMGSPPCEFPFGTLYHTDSLFRMDLMNNDHEIKRKFIFNQEEGRWLEKNDF